MLRSQGVVLVVQRVSHFCWDERVGSLITWRIMATGGGIEDIVMRACVGLQGFGMRHVASKEGWVVLLGKGGSEGEGELWCVGEGGILMEGVRRHGDEGYMDG